MKYKIINFFTKYKYKFIGLYQQWTRGWSYYNEDGNFVEFDYFILDVIFPRFADEWMYTREHHVYETAKDKKAKEQLDIVYDWYKNEYPVVDEEIDNYWNGKNPSVKEFLKLENDFLKRKKEMAITLMKYNEYVSW